MNTSSIGLLEQVRISSSTPSIPRIPPEMERQELAFQDKIFAGITIDCQGENGTT